MYINVYKAEAYSYTDKNFQTIEEVKKYLKMDENEDFHFITELGALVATYGKWEITIKEGEIPNIEEGYVDMLEESGALEISVI